MTDFSPAPPQTVGALDSGLAALCAIAAYYRVVADPIQLAQELALGDKPVAESEILRAANIAGLKARLIQTQSVKRLRAIPVPAIVKHEQH